MFGLNTENKQRELEPLAFVCHRFKFENVGLFSSGCWGLVSVLGVIGGGYALQK